MALVLSPAKFSCFFQHIRIYPMGSRDNRACNASNWSRCIANFNRDRSGDGVAGFKWYSKMRCITTLGLLSYWTPLDDQVYHQTLLIFKRQYSLPTVCAIHMNTVKPSSASDAEWLAWTCPLRPLHLYENIIEEQYCRT